MIPFKISALLSPKFTARFSVLVLLLALGACQKKDDAKPAAIGQPVIKKVTEANYMTGTQFCRHYAAITSLENGKRIDVPRDYKDPSKGTLQIYAFTAKPFDPAKETFVFVDGGPGQNSHTAEEMMGGTYNEIHFDQRGLGCSAPETYALYKDQSLYSSENTIRDMEEIRKSYGISKWSVYGVSYGTVPATMYGARYEKSTRSIVLEGVVGPSDQLHRWSYKAEKLNIVLSKLTPSRREGFSNLLLEESEDAALLVQLCLLVFMQDAGLQLLENMLNKLIDEGGNINRDAFSVLRESLAEIDSKYDRPQQPMGVDENILNIIFCKELHARERDRTTIDYSRESGFSEVYSGANKYAKSCDEVGVTKGNETPYQLANFKVSKPVYYFQGSHDGATLAKGAIQHWLTVPQKEFYFMLAQKGGHNPSLGRIGSENDLLATAQRNLFGKALTAETLAAADLEEVNRQAPVNQKWLLYTAKPMIGAIDRELEGIVNVGGSESHWTPVVLSTGKQ